MFGHTRAKIVHRTSVVLVWLDVVTGRLLDFVARLRLVGGYVHQAVVPPL